MPRARLGGGPVPRRGCRASLLRRLRDPRQPSRPRALARQEPAARGAPRRPRPAVRRGGGSTHRGAVRVGARRGRHEAFPVHWSRPACRRHGFWALGTMLRAPGHGGHAAPRARGTHERATPRFRRPDARACACVRIRMCYDGTRRGGGRSRHPPSTGTLRGRSSCLASQGVLESPLREVSERLQKRQGLIHPTHRGWCTRLHGVQHCRLHSALQTIALGHEDPFSVPGLWPLAVQRARSWRSGGGQFAQCGCVSSCRGS
mmetsp:Transcript_81965/g.254433  ORF Transcript_81965/g.254433 Transcript_81965/m.254433 type:complete len:260 (-) Transcript_81965:20-799(-)